MKSATICVVLGVMLSCGVGVPVTPLVRKDTSRPFPCQGSACACRDADACWQACCCMNDEQKLQWAQEHGVQPPRFLVQRVQKKRAVRTSLVLRKPSAACCRKTSKPACCSADDASRAPAAGLTKRTGTPRSRLVLLSAQSRCQGYSYWFTLLSTALVEVPVSEWKPERGIPELVVTETRILISTSQRPPLPPPRCV